MSNPHAPLSSWVDQRLEEILAAPQMWGLAEAVEMQVLLLIEARWFALQADPVRAAPRHVIDLYIRHLRARFPHNPDSPLFKHIGNDYARLAQELAAFRAHVLEEARTSEATPDDRRQHEDLNVIQLDADLREVAAARRKVLEPIVRQKPRLADELRQQANALNHVLDELPVEIASQ